MNAFLVSIWTRENRVHIFGNALSVLFWKKGDHFVAVAIYHSFLDPMLLQSTNFQTSQLSKSKSYSAGKATNNNNILLVLLHVILRKA